MLRADQTNMNELLGQAMMETRRKPPMPPPKSASLFTHLPMDMPKLNGNSGGGSTTLGLMFQYPGLFQTGISMSPVTNLLTYDNIYEERYMGLPQENMEDYVKGSAITYAKNLVGHLLLIHGTGDDNVHYQNTEMLVNELIKDNKVFEMMAYPNRSHGLYEGIGSYRHITTIFLDFLKRNCPPGGR